MSQDPQTPTVKDLTITDLPILERPRFFFVAQLPMKNELIQYLHEKGITPNLSSIYGRLPQNAKLAEKILFDPRRHLIYKDDLNSKYDFQVLENAKSYLECWIKMPGILRKNHIAVLGWFIDQIVDIKKTCALNQWTL